MRYVQFTTAGGRHGVGAVHPARPDHIFDLSAAGGHGTMLELLRAGAIPGAARLVAEAVDRGGRPKIKVLSQVELFSLVLSIRAYSKRDQL